MNDFKNTVNNLNATQKNLAVAAVTTVVAAAGPFGPLATLGLIVNPSLAATVFTKGRSVGVKIGQATMAFGLSIFSIGVGAVINPTISNEASVASTPAPVVVAAPAPVAPVAPPAPVVAAAPVRVSLPFTPSVAPPRPNTNNPIAIKRWNERVAEVAIENDPARFNNPVNGGETTLAQKCEAHDGGYMGSFEFGFQASFEHEIGDLSPSEACDRVQAMGLG